MRIHQDPDTVGFRHRSGDLGIFLGGLAAGASALWHRANDGMVNGVVTWTAVLVLLTLALRRPARVAR
jgi:hypothetical protein